MSNCAVQSRQDGTSPSESELAKMPSASASLKSGSASSTPEDGAMAEAAAQPEGPLGKPAAQVPGQANGGALHVPVKLSRVCPTLRQWVTTPLARGTS